jgi:ABC-type glutathione transport system ATPase component
MNFNLTITDFSLSYRSRDKENIILDNIHLSLVENEVIAIMGASGSGKSQLGMAIAGIVDNRASVSGIIQYTDTDLSVNIVSATEKSLESIRGGKIAYVMQDAKVAFDPIMKILHQVQIILPITEEDMYQTLQAMGFNDVNKILHAYPHQLSGGELQRINCAIALWMKPNIIIADEIISALDYATSQLIIDTIFNYQKSNLCSIIFITHDLYLLAPHINKVYTLQNTTLQKVAISDIMNNVQHRALILVEEKTMVSLQNVGYELTHSSSMSWLRLLFYCKKSDPKVLLRPVSFNIHKGETVGVLGLSGSGKTTLGKILAGLITPTGGSVQWYDHDVQPIDFNPDFIQYVFQNPASSLPDDKTIRFALTEPYIIKREVIDESALLKKLDEVNVDKSALDKYPNMLSIGQQQRICIARALTFNPRLIILDEAISALDHENRDHILNLLKYLQAKYKCAYLFISHDEAIVTQISNKVIYIS